MRSEIRKASSDKELMNFLSAAPWMSSLSADDLQRVISAARQVHVPEGRVVIRHGDRAEYWFGVIDGLLVQALSADSGKFTELTTAASGAWFGEGTLLKHECWRYDVIALRRSHVVLIPVEIFDYLCNTSLPFNHFVERLLNERLGLCVGLLVAERLLDPEAKVARLLAGLCKADHATPRGSFVPMKQMQIAMLAGLSRQRTNVALNRLQELDYVKIRRDGIIVRDLIALRTHEPNRDIS